MALLEALVVVDGHQSPHKIPIHPDTVQKPAPSFPINNEDDSSVDIMPITFPIDSLQRLHYHP
jgi:hypothetical protein